MNILNEKYICSKDYNRMYSLIKSEVHVIFRSKHNSEFRTYPKLSETLEKFITDAKDHDFEFIDPESQSDFAECVNQLQEYKAYAAQAVAVMEENAENLNILRNIIREINDSAFPAKIISMSGFLHKLREKCQYALEKTASL